MKDCGECTWCCFHTEATSFEKKNGWCIYCKNGCFIYNQRPDVCRNFDCIWRMEDDVPESYRPDRCGVMFERPFGSRTYIGHINPGTSPDKDKIAVFVRKINQIGHSVVLIDREKRYLSLAEGDNAQTVITDLLKCIDNYKSKGIL